MSVPAPLVIVEPSESGVRLTVDTAAAGFDVLNVAGRVIAWRAHIEEALLTQRELDDGEDVRRVSDGATMATKGGTRNGESFYATIWRMNTEPPWESR